MAMGKEGNTPSRAATEGDNAAGVDDPRVLQRPGSVPQNDEVAMVSRNADNSDAQPNKTVRVLNDKAAREADQAQAAINNK